MVVYGGAMELGRWAMFVECTKWRAGWKKSKDGIEWRVAKVGVVKYIYFQCSNEWSDWKYNADIRLRKLGTSVLVHRGFMDAWESIRTDILCEVMGWGGGLVLVGYSHGGGIAQIASIELHSMGIKAKTYCYGSPRAVWWIGSKLKRIMGIKVIQFIRRGDLFAMLIPRWIGYKRIGEEVYLGPKGMPSPMKHTPEAYKEYL